MAGAPRGGQGKARGWGESLGRKAPWTVIAAQLARGLWRAILAHGAVGTLLISVKL